MTSSLVWTLLVHLRTALAGDDQPAAAVAMGTGRLRGRRLNLDGRWVSAYLPPGEGEGRAGGRLVRRHVLASRAKADQVIQLIISPGGGRQFGYFP